MFAITAAISLVMERFSALKEEQDKLASDKRVQEAIRRLATTYKDLGENATEAQKRARAFEVSLVDQDYDKALANLEKVNKKLEELRDLSNERIGNWLQRTLQAMNLANMDVKPQKGESFSDAVYRTRLKERAAAELEVSKKAREVDKIAGEANVVLQAQKRVDLSKEYAELQRQQQNDLFQQRQTLAQKEVEIFRAAGELRIFQMEQANAKLIEGEEGASRTALEALNNYLSVRENGELEIEAAKKDIAIEVANLEKTIADYRFENEKKIAEIRKRSGENEKAMADAQRQAAGQAPAAPGVSEGFRVGSTGRSSGPHLDIRGSDRESVVREAASIIKAWQGQNLPYITLPNANIDVKNMTDEAALLKALRKEQVAHDTTRNRRIGKSQGAIDIAVPSGTLVPTPASAPSWAGAGGWQATSQATGNRFLHGLKDSKASPPGAAPAAAPTPALQSLDFAGPSIAKYEEAVRGVGSAMERVRTLQAALTEAQTVAAFEAIAKAAFPKAAIEGYQDSLYEAQLTYDAIAASSADAFNPERSALAVQTNVQINRSAKELEQIMAEVTKRQKAGQLTAQETNKIIEGQTKAQAEYVARLREAEAIQAKTLAIKQASDLIQSLKAGTKAIYDDIEAIERRNELTVRGYAPEVIEAELNKLQIAKDIARETERLTKLLNIELKLRDALQKKVAEAAPGDKAAKQAQLDAALNTIRTLQAQLAGISSEGATRGAAEDYKVAAQTKTEPQKIESRLATVKKELKDLTSLSYQVTQGAEMIGKAFSQSFMGLISGSMTAKEALASFFKSVGDHFMDMAARMIAKMIEMFILQTILGIAGGAAGGSLTTAASPEAAAIGQGSSIFAAADGAYWPGGFQAFADGGLVTKPTMGLIGEGGESEYVIPASKMQSAMSRYSRGARGEGVIAGSGGATEGGGGAAAAGPMVVDVRYSVERINDVEYVTASQFQAGMRQAAQQGAAQGEQRTLRRLQQSPGTRKRVGM
jgi:hypothetical protein